MKRTLVIAIGVVLVVLIWRALSSRNETFSPRPKAASRESAPGSETLPSTPVSSSREVASLELGPRSDRAGVYPTGADSRRAALVRFELNKASSGGQPTSPPADLFKDVPRLRSRAINGHPYQVLGVRAVPRDRYSPSMGDILSEQLGFAIVAAPSTSGGDDQWRDLVVRDQDRPVLINPANGRLAIVTGTIAVKLKDLSVATQLATAENLEKLTTDESINTVYFKAPEGYLLLAGQQRLTKDPNVDRVEIELYHTRKGGR